ncbi:MAG: S1C family serine protease [Fuerstiella sp.]|nr:S1C family serine protease [Fuerstiella sp.]
MTIFPQLERVIKEELSAKLCSVESLWLSANNPGQAELCRLTLSDSGRLQLFRRLCLMLLSALLILPVANANVSRSDAIVESCSVVVKLFGAGVGNLDSYGSGILISDSGHVVTVWNHLINTGYLTAVTSSGHRYQLDVVGTSAAHDLAVLKLITHGEERFGFVDRAAAAKPEVGSEVRAFSNMFHVATGNEPVSVVHGIVAADAVLAAGFGRWKLPIRSSVLILDAITNNSGAAGGLLTDVDGTVIGMLGRELRHDDSGTWVNYAVPFATLNPVIDAILSGGSLEEEVDEPVTRPLSDRDLTSKWGMTLLPEVLEETPAYIDRVISDSVSAKAGLRRGDLVVLVNDEVIQTSSQFRTQLAKIRSGLRLTITVNRDGALESIQIRVP